MVMGQCLSIKELTHRKDAKNAKPLCVFLITSETQLLNRLHAPGN